MSENHVLSYRLPRVITCAPGLCAMAGCKMKNFELKADAV